VSSFSYVASPDLGRQIAAVLGIDVTQVYKMTIEMNVDGPAVVIIEAFVPDDYGDFVRQISRYKLVADEEAVLDG
jgi:hypothetical protein